eukprot:s5036_g2.t2
MFEQLGVQSSATELLWWQTVQPSEVVLVPVSANGLARQLPGDALAAALRSFGHDERFAAVRGLEAEAKVPGSDLTRLARDCLASLARDAESDISRPALCAIACAVHDDNEEVSCSHGRMFTSSSGVDLIMRPPYRRRQPRVRLLLLRCLSLACIASGTVLTASTPPAWWRQGRPRKVFGSRAEVELLSQLAVLLMPGVPIAEVFRDFPCEPSKEWGSSRLCPDFAAYGVLKATDAALFIEYDGYYRHLEPAGLLKDGRKTRALLQFAPLGSVAVRIVHKEREWKDKSMHVLVLGLSIEANLKPTVDWIKALGLSQSQVAKVTARFPPVLGYSIEANLKPTVDWIKGLGLSQSQVAKVTARFPQVLGHSIEANLKPTVAWMKGLGLNQSQVAKAIATFPQVLGLSIEANLKPTVDWLKGLGLSQSQVAKVIARSPQILSLSIEANLKPTVKWIRAWV